MLLSGENYIYTPRTQEISFVFQDLYVDNTGVAEIGFSGDESKFYFLISGERLIDPGNNFAYTCPPDSPITISGDFNGAKYRYFIDKELSSDGESKDGFNVEKFYVKTTDCQLGVGLQMLCKPISYEIQFDENFTAGSFVNGEIFNYSNIDFDILGSRIIHAEYVQNFTGQVTGIVPAQGTLDFKLWDVSNLLSVPEAEATLELDTTIGLISYDLSPRRISGFFGNTSTLAVSDDQTTSIEPFFYGSGDWENFTWLQWPSDSKTYYINYSSRDSNFNEQEKPLWVSLKNISPTNESLLTGTYITSYFVYDSGSYYCTGEDAGCSDSQYETRETCEAPGVCSDTSYTTKATCEAANKTWTSTYTWGPLSDICKGNMAGSGRYSGVPDIEFLTYSRVTGVSFNSNNLFSFATPSKIPMLFSGYPGELGDNAAGYFLTEDYEINLGGQCGDGGGDGINWKRIVSYEMTNFGTGYTKMPAVFAATGASDVACNFSSYIPGVIIDQLGHCSDSQYTSEADCGSNDKTWYPGEDVAWEKNVFTFSRFQATGVAESQASALTGIPYFVNTGNSIYGFSGIVITNPGTGYDPDLYIPRIRIERQSTDLLGEGGTCSDAQYTTKSTCEANGKTWVDGGDNLSGEFFFNKSGTTYNFTDVWNMETGLIDPSTSFETGADFKSLNYIVNDEEYSHTTSLSADHTEFYTKLTFSNLDIDGAIKAKLTISGESALYEETISIQNLYTEETGMAYIPNPIVASAAGTSFVTTYFS